MNRKIYLTATLLIVLLINSFQLFSQNLPADKFLLKTFDRIKKLPNYTCDVEVKVDVDFIKIGDRKGKLTFIQPDSVNYDIEGFALLPKEDPLSRLKDLNPKDYTIIEMEAEKYANSNCRNIKVIPNDIDADLILAQMCIDEKMNIRKVMLYTKKQGKLNFVIDYLNDKNPFFKTVTLLFDIKDMKVPAGMSGDLSKFSKKNDKKNTTTSGKIIINYSNYKTK